jgi:nitrate reductase NapE component
LYALTIALARTVTFNTLNPVVLMMGINLIAFSFCVLLVIQFSRAAGTNQLYAAFAALLFGLWPFVGLTYTVNPQADIPAIVLTLGGLLMLQKSRYKLAPLLFGLAIITHKGVWPVIGLVTLADFYTRREFWSKRNFLFLAIMLFPLATLWVAGAYYHNSVNWLMARSMQVNTSPKILDGLFGTFQEGGAKGILKGSLILFFLILSATTLFTSLKMKFKYYELCAAIAAAILLMFIFSSAGTIWGPVRFSKFLVIPFILSLNSYFGEKTIGRLAIGLDVILMIGLFMTQLFYAWYSAAIFYG